MSNVIDSVAGVPLERLRAEAERDVFVRVGAAGSARASLTSLDDPAVVGRLQQVSLNRWQITSGVQQVCGPLTGMTLGLFGSARAYR